MCLTKRMEMTEEIVTDLENKVFVPFEKETENYWKINRASVTYVNTQHYQMYWYTCNQSWREERKWDQK